MSDVPIRPVKHRGIISGIVGDYVKNKRKVLFGFPTDVKYLLCLPNMYASDAVYISVDERDFTNNIKSLIITTKAGTVAGAMWPCKLIEVRVYGTFCVWSCPLGDPEMVPKARKVIGDILDHRRREDFWLCFSIISKLLLFFVIVMALIFFLRST